MTATPPTANGRARTRSGRAGGGRSAAQPAVHQRASETQAFNELIRVPSTNEMQVWFLSEHLVAGPLVRATSRKPTAKRGEPSARFSVERAF